MNLLGVEHIGIVVADLDAAVKRLEDVLGVKCRSRENLEAGGLEMAIFQIGEVKVEILSPTREGTAVSKFLAERGGGIHHVCFKVQDIKGCLEELDKKGVGLIDKVPREGASGHKIAFINPKSVLNVLMELCESK
ncbi:MAG: methylmalonyl-CoA epimerase [bacterium]